MRSCPSHPSNTDLHAAVFCADCLRATRPRIPTGTVAAERQFYRPVECSRDYRQGVQQYQTLP